VCSRHSRVACSLTWKHFSPASRTEPSPLVRSIRQEPHIAVTKGSFSITIPSQQEAPTRGRGDGSRVSASHPETATHCGAKQQRSPIPGRQPQQVASLHLRTANVTCPVSKQITRRSSCLYEHCLEPHGVSKTSLCISQRPIHSWNLRKIPLLLHTPCLPLSRYAYHFSVQFDCPNRSSMIRRGVVEGSITWLA
jgi:hypothetical protein